MIFKNNYNFKVEIQTAVLSLSKLYYYTDE